MHSEAKCFDFDKCKYTFPAICQIFHLHQAAQASNYPGAVTFYVKTPASEIGVMHDYWLEKFRPNIVKLRSRSSPRSAPGQDQEVQGQRHGPGLYTKFGLPLNTTTHQQTFLGP